MTREIDRDQIGIEAVELAYKMVQIAQDAVDGNTVPFESPSEGYKTPVVLAASGIFQGVLDALNNDLEVRLIEAEGWA